MRFTAEMIGTRLTTGSSDWFERLVDSSEYIPKGNDAIVAS